MNQSNTALITGASGGIGLELARIHAQNGCDLVIVARSEAKLNRIKRDFEAKYGIKVTVITSDLSMPNSAKQVFEKTEKLNIQVEVLINNAGLGGHGKFHERSLLADQEMMQLNMVTLTNLTHYYLQGMVERNKGKILNVSSTASFLPGPLQAVYFASKAYVTSFSQAIAEEVKEKTITITALCPGMVNTNFVKAGNLEGVEAWKNAKSPESVAKCGYNAMEKGRLIAINESGLTFLLKWIIPLLPRKMLLKISRQAMEKTA